MATLSELLTKLDANSQVRGRQFEHICKWYLENDPKYKLELKKVWLWNKWPGTWGPDAGIDLNAKIFDNKLWSASISVFLQSLIYSDNIYEFVRKIIFRTFSGF